MAEAQQPQDAEVWWPRGLPAEEIAGALPEQDICSLRATCTAFKHLMDGSRASLRPVHLDGRLSCLLSSSALPGLKALMLDQLQHLRHDQLLVCSGLTQLTLLHLGGPPCAQLRAAHLSWVGKLTGLQDLSLRNCFRVRLSVLAHWHPLLRLQRLALVGMAVSAGDTHHLPRFLAAGAGARLTALVLGDSLGLSFLPDSALEGIGGRLGSSMRELDLSGCIELTDAGIRQLAGLSGLRRIQLHNCMKVGSGTLQVIERCFTNLTDLSLRGCSQLTDGQLQHLLHQLTGLRRLSLQSCSTLTGECLSPAVCSRLGGLSALSLAHCASLQASSLRSLAKLPALQELDVTGCPAVSGADALGQIAALGRLTQLQGGHLRCKGEPAAAAGRVVCGGGGGSDPRRPGGCAKRLLPPGLQQLGLPRLVCRSAELLEEIVLSLPPGLTSLDLSHCAVGGFAPGGAARLGQGLSPLTQLRRLDLRGCCGSLQHTVLGFLSELTRLTELHMDHVQAPTPCQEAEPGNVHSSGSSSEHSSNGSSSGGYSIGNSAPQRCGPSSSSSTNSASTSSPAGRLSGVAALAMPGLVSEARWAGKQQAGASRWTVPSVQRILFPQDVISHGGGEGLAGSLGDSEWALQGQQQQQQQESAPVLAHLRQMQRLSVSFSPWMDDQAASELACLSRLVSLSLVACRSLTGRAFASWGPMPNLRSLNLAGCSAVGDEALLALGRSCWHLQELAIPGCCRVSDQGVASLGQLSALRRLNVASNRNITSRSLAAVLPTALRHLRHLVLSLAAGVCDEALHHLAAAPSLTTLDLRGCWRLTDDGLRGLLLGSHSLLLVNVESCHRLSSYSCPPGWEASSLDTCAATAAVGGAAWRPGVLVRTAVVGQGGEDDVAGKAPPGASSRDQASCCAGPTAGIGRFDMGTLSEALQHPQASGSSISGSLATP